MSGSEEVRFSMKVMINKDNTKILFAVVDNNLADVLVSFLTLPLGAILQLLKKQYKDQAPVIGSFNTLYNGLVNLDSVHFSTEASKLMLLNPRNSSDRECRNLKLNMDDTQPIKYFTCQSIDCPFDGSVNLYYVNNERCHCGKLENREIFEKVSSDNSSEVQSANTGVFFSVKSASFIVSDDLKILPNVTGSILENLDNMGITDTEGIKVRDVTVGFSEIMNLFKGSLLSDSPLTDLFIRKRHIETSEPSDLLFPDLEKITSSRSRTVLVKAMVQKSTKKLLFVQSEKDFVDFIFSFLTIPLGQFERLLRGNTPLGSIDNLYRSLVNMDEDKYFKKYDAKQFLIDPKLPPKFLSKSQVFPLTEQGYSCSFKKIKGGHMDYLSFAHIGNGKTKDPRGPEASYVKGPGMFIVTDDLTVTPLCILSSISTLQELNIPLSDVEELKLHIGFEEGLSILKASLTSTNALTDGLINPFLAKPSKEDTF